MKSQESEELKNDKEKLRNACQEKQKLQTINERMAPYAELIKQFQEILAQPSNTNVGFGHLLGFKTRYDYTEFVAALAFFEEYNLLRTFISDRTGLDEDFDMVNATVRPQFAYWEPTPLYFISTKSAIAQMKNPCEAIRFLVSLGADVNRPAGDGTTVLWNQTHSDSSYEILKTLLEQGADPNQVSTDGEYSWVPLASFLFPQLDEEYPDHWFPFGEAAIKGAKLLLEYGADPNLANPTLLDYPPLMLAVTFAFPEKRGWGPLSPEALEFIELLLKNNADPNFVDENGNTPLTITAENNYLEVGQLLLLYGAKIPEPPLPTFDYLKAAEDCFFRPGAGQAWEGAKTFSRDEILNSETGIFSTGFYQIIITEKTPSSLKGRVYYSFQNLTIDGGTFALDLENRSYATQYENVAYDTHMRLVLRLVSENEEEESTSTELTYEEKELLENLPQAMIDDYCRFAFTTKVGKLLRNDCEAPLHAMMHHFGVFMAPFKDIMFPGTAFDNFILGIEQLNNEGIFRHIIDEAPNARHHASSLLLSLLAINFDRLAETGQEYSTAEIHRGYATAENLFRRDASYYNDAEFLGMCACLYRLADIEIDIMNGESERYFRECQSVYYNLSQRDDLFTEDQRKVLSMLNVLIGKVRDSYEVYDEEDTEGNPIVQLLAKLDSKFGLLPSPAPAAGLVECNSNLSKLGLPKLPDEYVDFLKLHDGFAFNSVELFGVHSTMEPETGFELMDIVSKTKTFNDYYVDNGYLDSKLLCFGSSNGDYYTYDAQTGKYQIRSHESIGDIWEEYDSFETFFVEEVGKWINE